MKYAATDAVTKIAALKKRLKIIQGGSSAGKTIAILLILIDRAQRTGGKLFSVVSETFPHLAKGAIRDFLSIMNAHGYYDDARWNRTEHVYTFETGSRIEFFSADSPDKVRGPRRDTLFINECNNVSHETFTQLSIRTNDDIFLDYNPVSEFWVHTDIIPEREHDFLVLTYKDNQALSKNIVDEIESRRGNKYFWRVFGEGLLGEVEGRVYTDWRIVDDLPHEARLARRGLDFGYTNDPSAMVEIYEYDGGIILDEVFYQRGMSNRQIADAVNARPDGGVLTVADSAEPKSIDELRSLGVNVIGSQKGPGSVMHGIQKVRGMRVSVTKRSVNVIREYRNYLFLTDKDGRITNEPDHAFSHSMDAVRYGVERLEGGPREAVRVPASVPNAYSYRAMRTARPKV